MTTTFLVPIVGARYRPPAQGLLSFLPSTAPLILIPEPDNPFDPNAIKVMLEKSTLSFLVGEKEEELNSILSGYGFDFSELISTPDPSIHLGYIKKTETYLIHPIISTCEASLAFDGNGWPCAKVKDGEGLVIKNFIEKVN